MVHIRRCINTSVRELQRWQSSLKETNAFSSFVEETNEFSFVRSFLTFQIGISFCVTCASGLFAVALNLELNEMVISNENQITR